MSLRTACGGLLFYLRTWDIDFWQRRRLWWWRWRSEELLTSRTHTKWQMIRIWMSSDYHHLEMVTAADTRHRQRCWWWLWWLLPSCVVVVPVVVAAVFVVVSISSITFSHVLFSFSFLHFFRFYFVLPASDSSSVHRISNNTHCLSAAISSLYRALSLFPSLSLSLSVFFSSYLFMYSFHPYPKEASSVCKTAFSATPSF